MSTLLHIYDASDSGIVGTVNSRNYPGTRQVCAVNASQSRSLYTVIDSLVKFGVKADAILFETHGSPGKIYFGGSAYNAAYLQSCMGRGWQTILSKSSAPKVYFNGCNVASTNPGWNFLEAAAKLFIQSTGQTMGHTSLGFVVPIYSFFTGHVFHFTGDTRTVYFDNGRVSERFEQSDV